MPNASRSSIRSRRRYALRLVAAVFFIGAGANHFRNPRFYERIIPPWFPSPSALVAISGVCEIVGGLGLLIRRLRRVAGIGLIALLVAVFPANIYMAVEPGRVPEVHVPSWVLWLRLPFQGVLMAWVWFVALTPAPRVGRGRPLPFT